MHATDVERRRNDILEIIVESYVSTANPVGSELISRKLRQSVSSATIRNVMAELERDGLLEQPHTSAGRVPTDRGYRLYVDSIMETPHLAPEEIRRLQALIEPEELDVEQALERVSQAMASLAHQAAFVVLPTIKHSTVRQIELVPLSVRKVLCVLVANDEIVASHVVEIVEPMTRDEAMSLARFLNSELAGVPFDDLLRSLERRLLAETDSFYHLIKRSLAILQHALAIEPNERLFLEGTSYVISQPEFSRNPRKAHELLKRLESQEELLRSLRQDITSEQLRVRIGREVPWTGFDDCSYVTAPFAIGGEVAGGVGVLGPKRMDYRNLKALVEGMGRCVTDLLARWGVE